MATRRQFLVGVAGGLAAAACAPPPGPGTPACTPGPGAAGPTPPLPVGTVGLVDEAWHRSRVTEWLTHATAELSPSSPTNLVNHLVRARRDPSYRWDVGAVTTATLAPTFEMLDAWKDTGDFQLMYLHWLAAEGDGVLDPAVISAIEDRFRSFRYWYDDPLPADRLDHKWFWSENHRMIFATIELLSGLRLPDDRFEVTGMTGTEHAERARARVEAWILERAHHGFSEWHSNVYMQLNISPLLTLIELLPPGEDELVVAASSALDLCLLDLALNLHRGAYGATRGRTYKKDKMSSFDEGTYGTAKFLFDDSERGWRGTSEAGPTFLAAAERYRVPEVLRRIATADHVGTVKERHGVHIDPHEPVSPFPQAAYGYRYDDPANLAFWWSHGALTTWHNLPLTIDLAERFRLWDTDLFRSYSSIRAVASLPTLVAQIGAHGLAPMAAAGVLGEAHTVCWRSPEVMLSTVVDHRAGDAVEQAHAWQATLDLDALVFTTHPSKPTPQSTEWRDDDGYWTGSASMPRSVQVDRTAVHLYRPRYESPTDPLLGPAFGYLPETHAYFPQDHFDEVVQEGGWTFGRKGDGWIGLWSWRPTIWRSYDPAVVATRGLVLPFDLVAPGGPDNVWIVEVGRAADDGSFAAFRAACLGAPIDVARSDADGFRVDYRSPAAGRIEWANVGPFRLDGVERRVRDHERIESPWVTTCGLPEQFEVRDGDVVLRLDLAAGARSVAG